MATPGYKPSPLSHGNSIRNSPFRRRDSTASPQSSPLRQTTPLSSTIKFDIHDSPSRPQPERTSSGETATTPVSTPPTSTPPVNTPPVNTPPVNTPPVSTPPVSTPLVSTPTASTAPVGTQSTSWTPKARATSDEMPGSTSQASTARAAPLTNTMAAHGTALSQLQPSQVRNLRDGFQILDRDSDGVVNREDVADMLNQLGLPSAPSDVAQFFPPSNPQTMTMPNFLNSLSTTLAAMSPQPELISAFSAFDVDDSGQVDVAELRDALLHTAPEAGEKPLTEAEVDAVISGFTGRRAFSRNMNGGRPRNEVFRYQEFVGSVMGSNGGSEGNGEKE